MRRSHVFIAVLLLSPVGASAQPASVTLAGSLQSALGCPADWDPTCGNTQLTRGFDDVWRFSAFVPAGTWQYKIAINNSWEENYGVGGVPNGESYTLELASAQNVRFYFSERTHWAPNNVSHRIVTAPGDYQSQIGCPGDWTPDCMRSWLQDVGGDGVYTMTLDSQLPPGTWSWKAAINLSWDENYGQGGVPGGDLLSFTVPQFPVQVVFSFVSATHTPSTDVLTPNAQLVVEPTDVELSVQEGSPAVEVPVELLVTPAQHTDVAWTTSVWPEDAWLDELTASGTLLSDETATLMLRVDPTGLVADVYSGGMFVHSDDVVSGSVLVSVTLRVLPATSSSSSSASSSTSAASSTGGAESSSSAASSGSVASSTSTGGVSSSVQEVTSSSTASSSASVSSGGASSGSGTSTSSSATTTSSATVSSSAATGSASSTSASGATTGGTSSSAAAASSSSSSSSLTSSSSSSTAASTSSSSSSAAASSSSGGAPGGVTMSSGGAASDGETGERGCRCAATPDSPDVRIGLLVAGLLVLLRRRR
ncbi:MAG: MYXO-CTERM sorting domain-containing protein [Myxococcota bacterium]